MTTTTPHPFNMYINGQWVEAGSGRRFNSINPATTKPWCSFPDADADDVNHAVESAHKAFLSKEWQGTTATQRGRLLERLAGLIEENREMLAQTETRDNGKLIRETRGQMGYLPAFYRYSAGEADKITGETLPLDKPDMFGATLREPLGVVAAVVSWNGPLYLSALKLAPALAAGNTVVIKPSEHASASLVKLMELFEQAGFPAGVVNLVTGYGASTGEALTSHPLVRKIAFTGGAAAARHVIRNSAENFAKLSLELGGKSPNIVFADADIESACNGIIAGVFAATGQSCVAGSRVLVQRDILDDVVERLKTSARSIVIGNPTEDATHIGPMATEAQLNIVESMVNAAKEEGVELLYGGKRPDSSAGWYFEPTIFYSESTQPRIVREEVFGPVMVIIPFDTEEEAISIANDTEYGLAAGIWTTNVGRAHRVSKSIRAGIVWVNTYRAVSAIAPIGGFGASGYGREGGPDSVRDYTESKMLWINLSSEPMGDPFVMR